MAKRYIGPRPHTSFLFFIEVAVLEEDRSDNHLRRDNNVDEALSSLLPMDSYFKLPDYEEFSLKVLKKCPSKIKRGGGG